MRRERDYPTATRSRAAPPAVMHSLEQQSCPPRSTEGVAALHCCYWLVSLVHRQHGVAIPRN